MKVDLSNEMAWSLSETRWYEFHLFLLLSYSFVYNFQVVQGYWPRHFGKFEAHTNALVFNMLLLLWVDVLLK